MLFETLNERQIEAVKAEQKSILVLAGAGSGKTKTLLQKIKYLITEKRNAPRFLKEIPDECKETVMAESHGKKICFPFEKDAKNR